MLLLAIHSALAQQPAVTVIQFKDGLEAALAPSADKGVVSVSVVVGVGSRDGPEQLAHMVEHLWFYTRDDSGVLCSDQLDAWGCDWNASTWGDRTDYRISCPSSATSDLLTLIERSPLTNVEPADLEREREVVIAEFVLRRDDSFRVAFDALQGKRAGRVVDEQPDADLDAQNIRGLKLEQASALVARSYTPSNTHYAIAGHFDVREVTRQLAASHGDFQRLVAPKPPPLATVEREQGRPLLEVWGPVEHPALVASWTVPTSATLGQSWTVLPGTYYDALADALWPDSSIRRLGCALIPGRAESEFMCLIEAYEVTDLAGYGRKLITQAQGMAPLGGRMQVAREARGLVSRRTAEAWGSFEDLSIDHDGRSATLAHHLFDTGTATAYSVLGDDAPEPVAKAIIDAGRIWLQPEQAQLVLVRPQTTKSPVELGASGHDKRVKAEAGPRPSWTGVDPASVSTTTLANGVEVVIIPQSGARITEITGWVYGGRATLPFGKTVYGEAWSRPPPYRQGPRYTKALKATGVRHWMRWHADDEEQLFDRMRGALSKRYTGEHDNYRWIRMHQARQESLWEDSNYWATKFARERVNPLHVLAQPVGWNIYEAMEGLDVYSVGTYLSTAYQPENVVLVITSPNPSDEVLARVERAFAGWMGPAPKYRGRWPAPDSPNAARPAGVFVFGDSDKSRLQLAMRCPLAPSTPQNHAAQELLGELASAAIRTHMREEQGASYAPAAGSTSYLGGSSELWASGDVAPGALAASVGGLIDWGVRMHRDGPEPAVLSELIDRQFRRSAYSVHNGSRTDDEFLRAVAHRWPAEWAANRGERLAAVDAKAIRSALGSCAEHMVVTVTGPEDEIVSALDQAGIEHRVLDWKKAAREERAAARHTPR